MSDAGATYGWSEIDRARKRDLIDAIASGRATAGPVHAELDLTDRCNIACYFCNQQDVRTKEFFGIDRVREMVDELAATGLRSVRLSGGGDPLYHRNILEILDLLSERGIVIDNVTTNAVLLGPEVAARLVRDGAREVGVSLNAADPADYQRMMQVKGALFHRVLENVRGLIELRGARNRPLIVCQFLLDKVNAGEIVKMYELAAGLGVDRISINAVTEIPRQAFDRDLLLTGHEIEKVRPLFEQAYALDRERRILHASFPHEVYNAMVAEAQQKSGWSPAGAFPTAPSFRDENGHCFFGWYTMVVRGNGDLYPCCQLMTPDYEPLGNAREGKIADHWNGEGFTRLRTEMRDVMLNKGEVFYEPQRFRALKKPCIEAGKCWLKNVYFRGDETFYAELAEAMEVARRREVRFTGTPRQALRALEAAARRRPRLHGAYEFLREKSRPVRHWLKRRFGLNLAGPAVRGPEPRA